MKRSIDTSLNKVVRNVLPYQSEKKVSKDVPKVKEVKVEEVVPPLTTDDLVGEAELESDSEVEFYPITSDDELDI